MTEQDNINKISCLLHLSICLFVQLLVVKASGITLHVFSVFFYSSFIT